MISCANKILSRSNNILSRRNQLKNKTRMSLPGFRKVLRRSVRFFFSVAINVVTKNRLCNDLIELFKKRKVSKSACSSHDKCFFTRHRRKMHVSSRWIV